MAKLLGNVIFKGRIKTLTGLHVGGSKDAMEIGGVDSPVLRDPSTKHPYIPGSSLKGKMRMLLEFAEGKIKISSGKGEPCDCGKCMVCTIFGNAADDKKGNVFGPTRLTIRDAYPTKETIEMWEKIDSELLYTEYKGENTIDRLTSAANPRFFERVVPNSFFEFEMVYSIFDFPEINDIENIRYIYQALKLLEHSSIGGHGSRGYGKIEFYLAEPFVFSIEDYQKGITFIKEISIDKKLEEFNLENILLNIKSKLKA